MELFRGVGAAMVTPFGKNGDIDYAVLDKYIEHLISGGVAALVPFGTTGEPATVTAEEYDAAARFIIEHVRGRVPVIIGAGSNSTAVARSKAEHARSLGADGVLVVTPYYNKCTQCGIIEHYKAVASAGLPVIAYNVPSRTGVNILPQTVAELTRIRGMAGIKEASGNIDQFQEVARICADADFSVYSGDDGLITVAMALGCSGVISVAANPAPNKIAKLCALCDQNKFAEARALQFELSEFIHALFCEVNPIPVKKAMQLIGFEVGAPRLPLTELEAAHTDRLADAMREVGLIK